MIRRRVITTDKNGLKHSSFCNEGEEASSAHLLDPNRVFTEYRSVECREEDNSFSTKLLTFLGTYLP